MYVCARCKETYDQLPDSNKCRSCGSRIFYKKREPVLKKIKAY